jgi:hypothetical protein
MQRKLPLGVGPDVSSSQARATVAPTSHPAIDVILKDLKAFSRRLKSLISLHNDEHRILDRLYYKGKNQHKSALFWKRVVEMRRYNHRLENIGIIDIVERFCCSFFGDTLQNR